MTHLVETYRISINAPPQAVFDYLADFTKHGEWNDGLSVEAVSEAPTTVGSEFTSLGKMMGKEIRNQIKVTEYEAPNRIAFSATDGKGFPFHQELVVDAEGEGTLLRRRVTFDMNPIMAMMVKLVIRPMIAGPSMNKALGKLKANLEA